MSKYTTVHAEPVAKGAEASYICICFSVVWCIVSTCHASVFDALRVINYCSLTESQMLEKKNRKEADLVHENISAE